MILTEIKQTTGTYVGCRFDDEFVEKYKSFIELYDIPNPVPADELHSTIMYSTTNCEGFKPKAKFKIEATPTQFDIWQSQTNKKNVLVLKLKSEGLSERHKEIKQQYNASYTFPTYKPHITFSYDLGDFDISVLPKFETICPVLYTSKEYTEDLDPT